MEDATPVNGRIMPCMAWVRCHSFELAAFAEGPARLGRASSPSLLGLMTGKLTWPQSVWKCQVVGIDRVPYTTNQAWWLKTFLFI